MDHCYVILDGYGDRDKESVDVITTDGEVIGTWVLNPEDHPGFIPLGQTEQIIWSPWVGELCKLVKAWQEERESDRGQCGQGHTT